MKLRDFLKIRRRKSFLTSVDKNTVQSSEGWKVSIVGNSPSTWKLLYFEGEKHLEIGIEPGMGGARGHFLYIYLSDMIRWLNSNGFEPISEIDRRRIADNIRCAMKYRKTSYRLA